MNAPMKIPLRVRTSRIAGFTLIELMIAVAIVGILTAIAYPAYNQSVRKARRAEAKTALLDLAQREERYLSTTNGYTDVATELGYNLGSTITEASPLPVLVGSTAYYTLSVTLPTSTTYVAVATRTGNQVHDGQCGNFMLTSTGVKGLVPGTATDSAENCW